MLILVYSIVYLSDTASECVLQELLGAVDAGITLSLVSHWYCDVSPKEIGHVCASVNPVLPANSGRSSDWYKASVYYDFV